MRFLRQKRKSHRVSARGHSVGFYCEDELDYYVETYPIGAAVSDWGPSDEPRSWPWSKKSKPTKSAFGFARALED